jgi:hypothetical protein
MIGLTDRERELAVASGGPGTGIVLALADLELFWEHHRANAPDVHELRLNIRIDPDSCGDRMAAVQAVADWLGVPVTERYGVHSAQRRFGTGTDSVLVECHCTPDKNATHALIKEAVASGAATPELAGSAV